MAVAAQLQRMGQGKLHRIAVRNNAEYAEHLNKIEGIDVINREKCAQIIQKHLRAMIAAGRQPTPENIELALEAAGWEILDWHRGYTRELAPPLKKGAPMRPKHPAGFADDTHIAMRSYAFEVNGSGEKGSEVSA